MGRAAKAEDCILGYFHVQTVEFFSGTSPFTVRPGIHAPMSAAHSKLVHLKLI